MSTSAHSDVAWESVHIKQIQCFDLSPKPLIWLQLLFERIATHIVEPKPWGCGIYVALD